MTDVITFQILHVMGKQIKADYQIKQLEPDLRYHLKAKVLHDVADLTIQYMGSHSENDV